jgi:DNA-binding NtrC family response regulator
MPALLLVDDESDILFMLEQYLLGRHFRFTSFNDPLLAMAHFREKGHEFDLALIDIRMPKMSGDELAHHIVSINPKMKIVLMSAYEFYDEAIMRMRAKDNVVEFLKKPFELSVLGNMIDKHLG